jgi:uncharacterized protein
MHATVSADMPLLVRTLLTCGLLGAVPAAILAAGGPQRQPDLAGVWKGAIDVAGTAIPMTVTFTQAAAGPSGAIDIQGARGLALRNVTQKGASVHFELPAGPGLAVFDGTLGAGAITGTFTQGQATGSFTLTRDAAASAAMLAPEPPPYRAEDVTFTNGAVTLAGTLTIPDGPGPFPAVVMITGSGPQNRDEELFGFKPFRVIADHLTRRGIAVLRYDDRGVGGSSGSLATSTTADVAGDALAGVTFLSARSEIAAGGIGLFGHSEGAVAAAIAASRSPNVAFIVMMAGTAVRGDQVLRRQASDVARLLGASDAQVAAIVAAHHKLTDAVIAAAAPDVLAADVRALSLAQIAAQPQAVRDQLGDVNAYVDRTLPAVVRQMQSPWMKYFLTLDPATVIVQVKCPILALFGGLDTQVPPDLNRAPLEAAAARGHVRLTVKLYPQANHLFIKAVTGSVTEYPTLEKVFVPGLLDDVTTWIDGVVRGPGRL